MHGRYGGVSYRCVPIPLRNPSNENVFEELTRTPAGSAVHMAPEPRLESQAGIGEDLRVEVAPVVDDDHNRRAAAKSSGRACERQRDARAVLRQRRAARS